MNFYHDVTRFTDLDIYLFKEGTHVKLFDKFGAHKVKRKNKEGYYFAVWAPNAVEVSIVADFNSYDPNAHPLKLKDNISGIWEIFIEDLKEFDTYKYHIKTKDSGNLLKSDPFAFHTETPPKSASKIYNLDNYKWSDSKYMKNRYKNNAHNKPINIYEVHLGSWKRKIEENNRSLTYEEAAIELSEYLKSMNYTHIELLPITEYPFEGSWGYQVTGYFAPTSRYGEPKDFMKFIDIMHKEGIGVILDWVPSHFVTDGHGLINFDGTCLYEHPDRRRGYHPEWKSAIFDYGKGEVRSFLISSALFWFEKYHLDGIRVDAVASMLYLNYARKDGEWLPNKYGGNENLEAIEFLKQLNKSVYSEFNDILMIAEESTAYPKVTKPVDQGGLGFGFKWNMGWMHDTLKYFSTDPLFRQYKQDQLTFSIWYAFDENFVLPLSHDEVVHLKNSLIGKMFGDENQKFAHLRALFAYMTAHPGKKLTFMGGEFAQYKEWNYKTSLDWHLLDYPLHKKLQNMVSDLNKLYKTEPALYLYDSEHKGFEWIERTDNLHNTISFFRKSDDIKETIIVVCNFADRVRENYRVAVPLEGEYEIMFNSQDEKYNGWNIENKKIFQSKKELAWNKEYLIEFNMPALAVIYFKIKK
jgi:1,4-alpha-glucan branching enzyme